MRFADPHACPSCGGVIAGHQACPHCQFVLSSSTSLQLWRTLQEADRLLEVARKDMILPAPVDETAGPPLGSPAPIPVPPLREKPVARTWSTGSIILGIGALCLLVAAVVFITVSWSVLGATGRTFVLLIITIVVGAGAVMVTRARLRASAEALWAIFFGLFTIDFFAARAYGLLALDGLDIEHAVLLYGVIAAIGGAATAIAARPTLPVVMPSLAAGVGVWTAAPALVASVGVSYFWDVFAGLVLTLIAAVTAWRFALKLLALIAGVAVALTFVAAAGGAIEQLTSTPGLKDLTTEGRGVPMLVMLAVTVAAGFAYKPVVIPAAALAVWGAGSLVLAPALDSSDEAGIIAASLLAAVPAVALIRGAGDWIKGARVAVAGIALALGFAASSWIFSAIESIGSSAEETFGQFWSYRLANGELLPADAWLAFVMFGGLAIAVLAALRWPELSRVEEAQPLPVLIAAMGVFVGVVAYEPHVVVAAFLALALSVGFLVFLRTTALDELAGGIWLGVGLAAVLLSAVVPLASEPGSLIVWLAVAAVLIGVTFACSWEWVLWITVSAATAFVIGSATVAADLADVDDLWICVTAVGASLLALVAASYPLRGFAGREAIEGAAGVGIVASLIAATDLSTGSQAFLWTIAGGVLVILGLFVADRHVIRYAGVGALGVAWVLRLVASNVETVEAYTAPFAVVLLGAGLLAMHENPRLRTSVALSPGLTLAFLPSIPQALDDPTGLRALVLGLAGLLALGIGLWRQWQMPFVFGTAVVTLLVLWNVGPLANGLPRWILFAVVGAAFSVLGITWENRVRNAKTGAKFVQNLK